MRQPWPQSPNGGRFTANLPNYRGFDSLAIDAEGNICVAPIYDDAIKVIPPAGEVVEVPDQRSAGDAAGSHTPMASAELNDLLMERRSRGTGTSSVMSDMFD